MAKQTKQPESKKETVIDEKPIAKKETAKKGVWIAKKTQTIGCKGVKVKVEKGEKVPTELLKVMQENQKKQYFDKA